MAEQHPVSIPSAAWRRMEALRSLPRTMRGGQRAMWAAGQALLPPHKGESVADPWGYPARLKRSTFLNAIGRAVQLVVGKVFAKPVRLGDDVPESIEQWTEDVDLRGASLHEFLATIFEDAWWGGLGLFLVDMPAAPDRPITLAEERSLGRRPFFVRFAPEDLIGWRGAMRGGRWRLTQVRLRERVTVEDGEFGEREEQRIRVYRAPVAELGQTLTTFEVWALRKGAEGEEWVLETPATLMPGMDEIPLVACYAKQVAPFEAEPPLLDLAYLNLSHWQKGSDLANIEYIANVPVPVLTGVPEEQFRKRVLWGADGMLLLPTDSKYGYLEHSGKSIGELKSTLRALEDAMRLYSLEPFLQRATGETTATGDAIRTAEASSAVQRSAQSLQDAAEQGLMYMAKWAGLAADAAGDRRSGGSVVVNQELGISPAGGADVDVLAKLALADRLSMKRMWRELQRRGILGPDFNEEVEAQDLGNEAFADNGEGEVDPAAEAALAGAGMTDDDAAEA